MSSFTTPLVVTPMDNGREWKLMQSFEYYRTDNEDDIIVVPAGFVTDFASVPRIFWNIFPPWGKYGKAAVLHDWLYSIEYKNNRKLCDDIFYEAMKILGVGFTTRNIIYYAVRSFGWTVWNKHSKEKVAELRKRFNITEV
jgi:hypothetical protein